MLPRHQGGMFDLKGGTGGITGMYHLKEFMEIHKPDHTFRVQSPENLDPEETVPDIPWVISEVPNVGSANPIVARVFVQSAEILKLVSVKQEISKENILELMHSCKENLIICEGVIHRIKPEYHEIIRKIEEKEIEQQGKALNPFPQIPDLSAHTTTFLTAVKRTSQRIAQAFSEFYGTRITNPRFDKMIEHLKGKRPSYTEYIKFLEENQINITNILDLRNYQEHPSGSKKTIIHNFRLTPQGIRPPSWSVTGKNESPLIEDMEAIVNFLTCFAEGNFLYCVFDNLEGWIPWRVSEIPEEQRNKECPVRYRVDINIAQLHKKPD